MDELREVKKPKMSSGSRKSSSGGGKSKEKEFKEEKLNASLKEKGNTQEREKRKSKSLSSGLKQDDVDGRMESKKINMINGSHKTLSGAEEDEENKENKKCRTSIKEKGNKNEKRRSKLSSKGLNLKDEFDGTLIDEVFEEKDLETSYNFKKNLNKSEESKNNKEENLMEGFKGKTKHEKEKKKSKSSSSGLKQIDDGQLFTDLSIKKERGSVNNSKKDLKEKKEEGKESERGEMKGQDVAMGSHTEDDEFTENPKKKRKSKTKSVGLEKAGSECTKIIKEEPGDPDFLAIHKEVKRKKSRVEDVDETNDLKTFKKEPVDQDFVKNDKKGKRKRSLAEDFEEAPSTVKKKKIKTEKYELENEVKKENGNEEVKKTKKKEKKESEILPKQEKNEGKQETKKKKTKEEKNAIADLKAKKKAEEEKLQWKWWEEQKYEDGVKWMFLEHKGPVFAPPYEPLPDTVKFYYDGKPLQLSSAAEEVASFFAKMLDHEYTTKDVFRKNFFMDWRKEMTLEEKMIIADLDKCNFTEMFTYYKGKMEEKKNITKEQKLANKEANEKLIEEFGFCVMDDHRERIGNFKIEPPSLFRGRGDHPKQGLLKKRILPENVIINCSKNSKIPEPPMGHRWKEVRHDNTVTWLVSWNENVQGNIKYVMLNASSKLKGEKDWEKYEIARKLKVCVDRIRAQYRDDWKSKEMKLRQRAVALYFIDKLALRAGNEKEEGETADTVGCCSLRVEHIKLYPELDGETHVVEFDFLGKDSIRYYNKVPVEKQVFKNLQLFMEDKQEGDDLFDRLNTPMLNKHLQSLMEGLTAKVFRTYNASITLQGQLKELTDPEEPVPSKILSYNRANRAVAILCNHQRAAPKTFEQSMANLQAKIEVKKEQISLAKKELKQAKEDTKSSKSEKLQKVLESKKKAVQRAKDQLMRLEVQATDREENKQVALGTSKLNYLDPRISVTWCQKWGVGLEKIYNKTQRDKFAWAINMSDVNFEF